LEENIKIYDGYEDKELAGCLVTVLTADLNFADRAECTVIAAEILSKVNVSRVLSARLHEFRPA
jgi:hypothetical protein